ncbi:MAG: hypothetical protein JWO77_85 [Ilumatobacteraceae bacterium]|nr:hypothetical protein [Ilumatobacteraceae bacterium]
MPGAWPQPQGTAPPVHPPAYPPPGAWTPPPQNWAPQGKRKRFGWGAVIVAFLIGGFISFAITLGGLIIIGLALGTPDAIAGTHSAAAEGADPVAVGDCLSEEPSFAAVVDQSDVVACDEAHDAEVAAVIEVPGGRTIPGEDDLQTFVDDACSLAFKGYVGSDPDVSQYGYGVIVPSDDAWSKGDKTAFCLVDTVGQPAGEGTVRGSGD